MPVGMTKPRIFRVAFYPVIPDRECIIFCRKIIGEHGWQRGKKHIIFIDSPSYARAQRVAVRVMERGE